MAARRGLSIDCPAARYPSVGALHAPAIRLERAMRDLFGLEADRRWRTPARGWTMAAGAKTMHVRLRLSFPAGRGRGLHQIPVGPVHAGIIEPGHFRFTATARPWSGWRSGWATSTRASNG